MDDYSKEGIKVFLEQQSKLYDRVVAQTVREAREWLAENEAVELDSLDEVKQYFEQNGMDISGMSDEEIRSQGEVFPLPSGRFLIVEG